MKTDLACLPCFFQQVTRTLAFAGVNGDQGRSIMRQAEQLVETASLDQAPARITTLLHRLLRREAGADPYQSVKRQYNRIAFAKLPSVKSMARAARSSFSEGCDPLEGGVRAAIAGNVIDFGIYDAVDLDRSLRDSFRFPLSRETYAEFAAAVAGARNILYLCDNAGEIAFDRVLLDELRGRGIAVTAVVKGAPVINDATLEDAAEVGLEQSARVIDNGNDGIGTLLELCSDQLKNAYDSADMIISKGQANFETLGDVSDKPVYFLFMVKCPVVAKFLSRENGSIVLLSNRGMHATGERLAGPMKGTDGR